MRNGPVIERVADCITVLKRKPQTLAEIATALGFGSSAARSMVQTLVDKGHAKEAPPVRIGRNWVSRWEWAQ